MTKLFLLALGLGTSAAVGTQEGDNFSRISKAKVSPHPIANLALQVNQEGVWRDSQSDYEIVSKSNIHNSLKFLQTQKIENAAFNFSSNFSKRQAVDLFKLLRRCGLENLSLILTKGSLNDNRDQQKLFYLFRRLLQGALSQGFFDNAFSEGQNRAILKILSPIEKLSLGYTLKTPLQLTKGRASSLKSLDLTLTPHSLSQQNFKGFKNLKNLTIRCPSPAEYSDAKKLLEKIPQDLKNLELDLKIKWEQDFDLDAFYQAFSEKKINYDPYLKALNRPTA